MTDPFIAANGALMQFLAGALATTPGLSADDSTHRAQMVYGCVMGFRPLNPVMTMLASQAVGHHFLLLDTLKEATDRPGIDAAALRLRKLGIAETRVLLSLLKELRAARKEHLAMVEAERDGSLPVPSKAAAAPAQQEPAEDPAIETLTEGYRDAQETLMKGDGGSETARAVLGKLTALSEAVVMPARTESAPADRARDKQPV